MEFFDEKCSPKSDSSKTPPQDNFFRFYPGTSYRARLKRWLRRQTTVSFTNLRAKRYLRSKSHIKYEQLRHLSTFPAVIHPFSNFRMVWEIYMLYILLALLFLIPYFMTFSLRDDFMNDFILYLNISCMFDIIVSFATGYFNPITKQVSLEPRTMWWKYVTGYFMIDLLSSIPLNHFLTYDTMHRMDFVSHIIIFDLMTMLKLLRLKTILQYLRRLRSALKLEQFTGIIIRGVVVIGVALQWSSCMLYHIPNVFYRNYEHLPSYNDSWFMKYNLKDENQLTKYRYSLFFGSRILFRVDHGYQMPKNVVEVVMVTAVTIVAFILFVWMTGEVLLLYRLSNSAKAKYEVMVQQLKEYMHHKQLPYSLRSRLLTYYEYRFQRSYFHESDILSSLTGQLRQDIILHSCQRLVENVEFFNNLPVDLLINIVQCLRSKIFLPHDVIVKAGTVGESMYFLASGTVAVYTPSGQELAHLVDGACFGEIAVITDKSVRVATVIALEICQVYRLHRDDFVRAVSPYPDLVRRIENTAKERLKRAHWADKQPSDS